MEIVKLNMGLTTGDNYGEHWLMEVTRRKQEITGPSPREAPHGSASINLSRSLSIQTSEVTSRKASAVQWKNVLDSIRSTFYKIYCFCIFFLPVILFRTVCLGFLGPFAILAEFSPAYCLPEQRQKDPVILGNIIKSNKVCQNNLANKEKGFIYNLVVHKLVVSSFVLEKSV